MKYNDEYKDHTGYAFQYTDCDGKVYNATIENPGPTWMEALNDYVKFLESVFTYEIQSNIRLKEPRYKKELDKVHDYIDPWTGEYFNDEEDDEDSHSRFGTW